MKRLGLLLSLLIATSVFAQSHKITYKFYVDGCNEIAKTEIFGGAIFEGDVIPFEAYTFPNVSSDYQFFYNLMVGGSLGFPVGSLNEDINVDIILSGLCNLNLANLTQYEDILQLLYLKIVVTGAVSGYHVENEYYYLQNGLETFLRLPLDKLAGFLNYMSYSLDDFTPFYLDQNNDVDVNGIRKAVDDNYLTIYSQHFSTIGVGFKIEPDDPVDPTSVNNSDETPNSFELSQNYPNPFNPETTISYSIANAGMVKLSVYNSLGEEIQSLVNQVQSAGNYNINFNAKYLPSGTYFYKITSGNFTQTNKMILMK